MIKTKEYIKNNLRQNMINMSYQYKVWSGDNPYSEKCGLEIIHEKVGIDIETFFSNKHIPAGG